MSDMPIELDPHSAPGETKYVDQEGDSVRILATDCGGDFPIVGVYWDEEGQCWFMCRYPADGTGLRLRPQPKPKPREWWMNMYSDGPGGSYETREEADLMGVACGCIACIRVREVLEGDDD